MSDFTPHAHFMYVYSKAERPDRLFDDPLSHHFAGDEAMRQARERANASR